MLDVLQRQSMPVIGPGGVEVKLIFCHGARRWYGQETASAGERRIADNARQPRHVDDADHAITKLADALLHQFAQ
jgi:hypothetical protein